MNFPFSNQIDSMKTIFTTSLLMLAFSSILFSQQCEPDLTLQDSLGFIYPPPYDSILSPEGGIDRPACIGMEYEFFWNVITPLEVELFGNTFMLSYLELPTSGAIANLPDGISYLCNPPNCRFEVGEVGCVLLYGTPTNGNPVKDYALEFSGTLRLTAGVNLPVTFPDPNIFPGTYDLTLLEAGNPACTTSSDEHTLQKLTVTAYPNPVNAQTILNVTSPVNGKAIFRVFDLTGSMILSENLNVVQGEQAISFDSSQLPVGYAFFQFSMENGWQQAGSLLKME
jgi:hypothetical protein